MRKRKPDQIRTVKMTRGVAEFAEGSVLIEMGKTRVLCTASVDDDVPRHRKNSGLGWVTAEYSMLPRATTTRSPRESVKGKIGGRTAEIQRLIGRALRSVVDFAALGERAIIIDCDVLQADGGTRTAAITGGYVALALACKGLQKSGKLTAWPLREPVAAISVGIVNRTALLDLEYVDDAAADVDMNVVMTGGGHFVEIQGTAENAPFTDRQLQQLLKLAKQGIAELLAHQRKVLGKG